MSALPSTRIERTVYAQPHVASPSQFTHPLTSREYGQRGQ